MKITGLTLWQVPLTSHIASNMWDGKICDTVTNIILRLDADNGLSGWGEVCPIPHYLPAYANGVAPALTELAPICRDMSSRASTHPRQPATAASSFRHRPKVSASIPTLICFVRRFCRRKRSL